MADIRRGQTRERQAKSGGRAHGGAGHGFTARRPDQRKNLPDSPRRNRAPAAILSDAVGGLNWGKHVSPPPQVLPLRRTGPWRPAPSPRPPARSGRPPGWDDRPCRDSFPRPVEGLHSTVKMIHTPAKVILSGVNPFPMVAEVIRRSGKYIRKPAKYIHRAAIRILRPAIRIHRRENHFHTPVKYIHSPVNPFRGLPDPIRHHRHGVHAASVER